MQRHSEFARLSEAGEVLAPAEPREILSPSVPRNAFTTFQVAIQTPPGTKYNVFVGQNPEDAAKVTLYRTTSDAGRDKLEPVGLPYEGAGPQVFWLDVWIEAAAPPRRIKVEPQVFIAGTWITYPMEVRVSEVVVPKDVMRGAMEPLEMMRLYLCRGNRAGTLDNTGVSVTNLHARNARQDVSLAAAGPDALRQQMLKTIGGCDAKPPADPEFYLRARDLLLSPAWQKMR